MKVFGEKKYSFRDQQGKVFHWRRTDQNMQAAIKKLFREWFSSQFSTELFISIIIIIIKVLLL